MNRPPRVNPFVGLPESSLRFILLALVALAAAAYAWQYIHQVIHQRSVLAAIETCTKLSLEQPDPPFRNAYSRRWAEQMARPLANSITLGLVLTTAVALVCFAVGPVLLRRWRGLRPLAATSEAADLPADVVELAAQSTRRRRPC